MLNSTFSVDSAIWIILRVVLLTQSEEVCLCACVCAHVFTCVELCEYILNFQNLSSGATHNNFYFIHYAYVHVHVMI